MVGNREKRLKVEVNLHIKELGPKMASLLDKRNNDKILEIFKN